MKKSTTKRLFALLLSLTMVVGLVAACGGDDDGGSSATPTTAPGTSNTGNTSSTDSSDGPVTIKVMQYALDNQQTDFENLWYFEQIEEMLDIKIEWTVVKQSEWQERLNMTFNSGLDNFPDVILRPDLSLNIEDVGVTQGLLLPLDDYISGGQMPNYAARLAEAAHQEPFLRSSDGKMYYLGYQVPQNQAAAGHFFINKTWLDAVNKEVPTTVDELTDVLRAFKAENPGADGMFGLSGGGGLDHQVQGIYNYFAMFGVPLQRFVYANIDDNGKVVFPGYRDGFREACEWLAMCYKEGWLDPDAISQSEDAWNVKVNADQVGFATYLRLLESAWSGATLDNMINILPPSANGVAALPRILEVPEYGAVVTIAALDNIDAVLKFLDIQFDMEMMMIGANGPMDLTVELAAVFGDDWKNDQAPLIFEDGMYRVPGGVAPENNALYKVVPVIQGQFFIDGAVYFENYEMPARRVERSNYTNEYNAAGVIEKNSYEILQKVLKPSNDDAAELNRLFADIESLMKETISTFILNGVTDATWDDFLAKADAVGVDRYLEIYQGYYDAAYGG